MGHVDRGASFAVQRRQLDVADDTDDLDLQTIELAGVDLQPLANRVLTGKRLSHQPFADNRDLRRVCGVRGVEIPSRELQNPHRAKELSPLRSGQRASHCTTPTLIAGQ